MWGFYWKLVHMCICWEVTQRPSVIRHHIIHWINVHLRDLLPVNRTLGVHFGCVYILYVKKTIYEKHKNSIFHTLTICYRANMYPSDLNKVVISWCCCWMVCVCVHKCACIWFDEYTSTSKTQCSDWFCTFCLAIVLYHCPQ